MSTLILVRGLPGAGKSSLFPKTIAADDYFMVDGEYMFDPRQLPHAHADCQSRAEVLLRMVEQVVVANTFSQRWEIEPYVKIAARAGARLVVADLFDGGLTDMELEARNLHGVPAQVIARMRSRWEHDWRSGNPVPPWERQGEASDENGRVPGEGTSNSSE